MRRSQIVMGKTLGGTILAVGQGLILLILAPLIGVHMSFAAFAGAFVTMLVLSFALTALGLCIAWRLDSTQGFHAIMNLFLMPMWFLSGALFPAEGAWTGLRWVMMLNPLTYGLAALRRSLYWCDPAAEADGATPGFASWDVASDARTWISAAGSTTGGGAGAGASAGAFGSGAVCIS